MTRDTILRISGRWVVALILLIAAAGLLVILSAKRAGEPGKSASLRVGKGSASQRTTGAEGARCWAEPGYTFRVVSVEPSDGVISAFEPIIVEVELTNTSSAPVSVYYSNDLSVRIEVRDSQGRLVGESPVYPRGDTLSFAYTLGPTRSMRAFFIPSAVYRFENAGVYGVKIMLLKPPGKVTYKAYDLGSILAEAAIPVTVLPLDEKRLRARCAELVKVSKERPYPTQAEMLALWTVRHNAALPVLKYVAENWGRYSYGGTAVTAMRRIGTPEAVALVNSFKSRKDLSGRSSRSTREVDTRIHESAYFIGWEMVYSPEATVNEFLCYYRQRQWGQAGMLFDGRFRRKYAAQLKDGSLFANADSDIQSILNDPRSRVLRSREEGKLVVVYVGRELGGGVGQTDIVRLKLVYNGPWWHLWDFPGYESQ